MKKFDPSRPIKVAIADDHALFRQGVRTALSVRKDIEMIAEADNGMQLLNLLKHIEPDVILLDIQMPIMDGITTLPEIRKLYPDVKVIILSMHANEEYVLQTLRAGASGYLLKDAATAELELAIQAVARRDTYLSPAISRRVIEDYLGRVNGPKTPAEQLTPRQREILQLVAEGKSTKEIAFLLKLSVKTVETHRAQLMDRLRVHDVPGLVRQAMRMGLVPPES